jgi:hypothetical protein
LLFSGLAALSSSGKTERRHEHRDAQDVRHRRGAAVDQMRGEGHEIAGDVGDEQPAQPEEADHIDGSRGEAEHARQQLHAELPVDRQGRIGVEHRVRPSGDVPINRTATQMPSRRHRPATPRPIIFLGSTI